MRAIDRKALRDLWGIKGQALAIALVIASGVALYVMTLSNSDSLRFSQQLYYERNRFADVFANAERAPGGLARRIAEIPGVTAVETRVVAAVTLDLEGMPEPVAGRLVSVPEGRPALLNALTLRQGRRPAPGRAEEVVVHEAFADAQRLGPGDTLHAILNGRRRQLTVVGVALAPEYVYTLRPGAMLPDDRRFGVLWMNRRALEAAFDLEGGFNDVALRLLPGASTPEVVARLDRLLEPYGGTGAIPRARQVSHWWVNDQLEQLEGMGRVIPLIFLGVGALLLTVVLNRMITVQRGQIAALKALGYSNLAVGRHYLLWGLAITAAGAVAGVVFGIWLGRAMLDMQAQFYRFPDLIFRLSPRVVLGAVVISLGAAVAGALSAVRRAVALPPAEAMQPEPPSQFRRTLLERLVLGAGLGAGLGAVLTPPARMVLRGLERRPLRALASVTGIAFGGAIFIVGIFSLDGMDRMLDVQFGVAQRQDVSVTFVKPVSRSALFAIARLPGVLRAEPTRSVAVRLRFGHRSRRSAIIGVPPDATLQRVIDASLREVRPPEEGLVLSDTLARLLGAARGDTVVVEVLEGPRPRDQVVVTDIVEEYMGSAAYMDLDALHRLMREGGSLSGANLLVDGGHVDELYRRLERLPAVASVTLQTATLESFDRTVRDMLSVTIFFNVLFAAVIAFGVVYNTARVSLSERARELASLRVLGFTRAEISSILLGELAVLTLLAVPLGLVLGWALAALTVAAYETEVYRIPLVVSPRVLATSAITVVVSAVVSGLAVRRRLDRLDLIAVLKSRE